ncbi:putative membrane protein, TIGR04086 family [Gracilibacillus ureilyticus]|uniref:Putative membrane protein, TIGR04086 family n=1 Tax=Gracilibacillus ureilyticus TaxID=531814 RepID=A0A1H9RNA0_9BACI|nr:TIGR04086 family membrane protein [Gracilibacillus ureilyticus]SER73955.1 putative membrane protein, TIGR04086 family [Gracilibacillus ureilyticus]
MRTAISVLFGWIGIIAVMFIASVILALLLRFTALGESTLNLVTLLVSFLALFVGGFIAGLKAKHKGIIVGAITSLIFTMVVFFYRYLGLETGFSIVQFVHHTAYLLLAMIGAIIGVNVSGGETAESNS